MRNKLLALAIIPASLVLSSCATDHDAKVKGTGGQSVYGTIVHYDGHDLHCIQAGHGLSCDWVRYHMENPR